MCNENTRKREEEIEIFEAIMTWEIFQINIWDQKTYPGSSDNIKYINATLKTNEHIDISLSNYRTSKINTKSLKKPEERHMTSVI